MQVDVKKIFFKLNFADNKINVNYSKYRTVGRKNIQLASLLQNTKVYFDLWFSWVAGRRRSEGTTEFMVEKTHGRDCSHLRRNRG